MKRSMELGHEENLDTLPRALDADGEGDGRRSRKAFGGLPRVDCALEGAHG